MFISNPQTLIIFLKSNIFKISEIYKKLPYTLKNYIYHPYFLTLHPHLVNTITISFGLQRQKYPSFLFVTWNITQIVAAPSNDLLLLQQPPALLAFERIRISMEVHLCYLHLHYLEFSGASLVSRIVEIINNFELTIIEFLVHSSKEELNKKDFSNFYILCWYSIGNNA